MLGRIIAREDVVMSQGRRDFIKATTTAITLLTVSKASAETATRLIGFVHSTQLGNEASQCFLEGLKYAGWQQGSASKPIRLIPKEANAQYGGTHGHAAIRALVRQHGRVHLIVAAGGVASQRSALEELSGPIPFVYLSGRI